MMPDAPFALLIVVALLLPLGAFLVALGLGVGIRHLYKRMSYRRWERRMARYIEEWSELSV
jgi:hypothetical protein